MYTTLNDAIHKLLIITQLSKRINIYVYIIILNLYFRHNFDGFIIVIIFEYLMAF
jgi:hypothetical protein